MKKYQSIYNSAVKYLAKGLKKNFVVHTEGVVKAMELILKKENNFYTKTAKDIFLREMKQRKSEFENI